MNQRQEVNLYLDELRPKIDYLSPTMVARGAVTLLLVLLLIACFDLYQNYQLNHDITEREASIAQLNKKIGEVKKKIPKSQGIKLDREIHGLGIEIQRREAISRLIDGQSIGNTHGFSEQLTALGENSSDKISLTEFGFLVGGDVISMKGQTRTAQSVPSYVDRLRQSESFSDSVFGPMAIARVKKQTLLDFSLNQDNQNGESHE